MADIILAEDTETIREGLAAILAGEFHTVRGFTNGELALAGYRRQHPDLMILDVMMPVMDGLTLMRKIRSFDSQTPILILSAKISESDRVEGLEQGADDYLCKPFGMRELIARVNALLRRHPQGADPQERRTVFDFGNGSVLPDELAFMTPRGRLIPLSRLELKFLRFLSENPNRILSRKEIFECVWQYAYLQTSRTLDTHVWKLRQKLDAFARHVTTVPTLGFRYTP